MIIYQIMRITLKAITFRVRKFVGSRKCKRTFYYLLSPLNAQPRFWEGLFEKTKKETQSTFQMFRHRSFESKDRGVK